MSASKLVSLLVLLVALLAIAHAANDTTAPATTAPVIEATQLPPDPVSTKATQGSDSKQQQSKYRYPNGSFIPINPSTGDLVMLDGEGNHIMVDPTTQKVIVVNKDGKTVPTNQVNMTIAYYDETGKLQQIELTSTPTPTPTTKPTKTSKTPAKTNATSSVVPSTNTSHSDGPSRFYDADGNELSTDKMTGEIIMNDANGNYILINPTTGHVSYYDQVSGEALPVTSIPQTIVYFDETGKKYEIDPKDLASASGSKGTGSSTTKKVGASASGSTGTDSTAEKQQKESSNSKQSSAPQTQFTLLKLVVVTCVMLVWQA